MGQAKFSVGTDEVWPRSWSDEFSDYQRWVSAKEPDGYVWGTNWSLAYPRTPGRSRFSPSC